MAAKIIGRRFIRLIKFKKLIELIKFKGLKV